MAGIQATGVGEWVEVMVAADRIIALAISVTTLFHDEEHAVYADVMIDSNRETHAVRSNWMRQFLRRIYYEDTSKAARPADVSQAIDTLEAIGSGPAAPEHRLFPRVATVADRLYVDLADDSWDCIGVDPTGWRVVSSGPHFVRSSSTKPLPVPVQTTAREGLVRLRRLLNVSGEDFVLVVGWLLAAMRAGAPYPVLVLLGEHGSAKTSATEIIRSLVDPSVIVTRAPSRTERDLRVATGHSHVMAFDNLSSIPAWLSDGLSRVSTGSGYPTRRLRTDGEESVICAMLPIILNGIGANLVRGDLADRAIAVHLDPIPGDKRRTKEEVDGVFQTEAPIILGALLDGLAEGLRNLPGMRLSRLPRMADFATWVAACETAYWTGGHFMHAYDKMQSASTHTVIEASTVGRAILALMDQNGHWSGTMSDLRAALEEQASDLDRRSTDWPGSAESLTREINRLTPDLRACGVEVTRNQRTARRRTVTISRRGEGPAE